MRGSADLKSKALEKGVGEMKIFRWDKISENMLCAVAARISKPGYIRRTYSGDIKRGVSDRI
jgi:hypothetical protein